MADAEHDFSTVPESFVTDGVPDFSAYRVAYDAALTGKGGTEEIDTSSIPEQFVNEGKADLPAYKIAFEDASAFKSRADERSAGLPKDADGYTFAVPEKFELPEGFTPPEDFKLEIKEDDLRIPAIKALAHEHKLEQPVLDAIAGIWAAHEVRTIHAAAQTGAEEMKKLGPNAEARMSALARVVGSRVPKEQAEAFIADITTADGLDRKSVV